MSFLKEPEPKRGVAIQVLPGIRRIVARNPSVMTYHGTNTFLIDGPDGVVVLDPGPDDAQHVADIMAAAGGSKISHLVLTHTHGDHSGALAALQAACGAPSYAYMPSAKSGFVPDFALADGDEVAGLVGVHTPGHASDHLCFAVFTAGGSKILFSGDHVMSWSSSIVSPPDGDMLAYYRGLELLLTRDETVYLCGHGPLLTEPRSLVAELLGHRQRREAAILAQMGGLSWSIGALAAKLYAKTDPWLKVAAQRNVLAHLLKLHTEGLVRELAPAISEPEFAPQVTAPPGEGESESAERVRVVTEDALRRFEVV
jgi:glyoxylase-like metal-dependent hydrolase (beta-lactamase superfamily II)